MWVTWEQYQESHPASAASMTEAEFNELANDAARRIRYRTHQRAQLATTEEEKAVLADCQAALITELRREAQEDIRRGSSGVASASNDGYSESYASAEDVANDRARRIEEIIKQTLSAPETMWLIYAGGVYHRPGRC